MTDQQIDLEITRSREFMHQWIEMRVAQAHAELARREYERTRQKLANNVLMLGVLSFPLLVPFYAHHRSKLPKL